MSLLDVFKPNWQSSNLDKRIKAVKEMDAREQSILERIATSDNNSEVRTLAIKKYNGIEILKKISKEDFDANVRRLAENRYLEEAFKKVKDFRDNASNEVLALIDDLKDSRYAEDLAKNMSSAELRMALIKGTGKANIIALAATRDSVEDIALLAVERITSDSLLQDIAKNSKHTSVRKIANEKIKAKLDAEDNGKKAAALLVSKREALIQQAHFFAAQKDPVAVKETFASLMNDAKVLGMEDKQAELDEIYASFLKFCNEVEEARLAAEKEAAAKAAEIAHLNELLDELENAALDVAAHEERIDSITAEWNEKKQLMEPAAIKRFNQLLFKIQDAKKKEVEIAPVVEEGTPQEDARKELLERLHALADNEVIETTSKHLHSLVREWEKLPLLEGEDPLLKAYNALRNQLSEKISAFNEKAEKIFAENSKKLTEIIERVKALDENEDFKDLSLKLKAAFLEWKEIVGENKFKYHDLWLEYKSATARFQDMRQWQSWHNENERVAIIEEMEVLVREEASPDVVNKLKELATRWKNCGPTPALKYAEYREKFQALFEKVRENCAGLMEEQMAERQNNLTLKEEICQKVEALVQDTETFWREKFKAMQELQENWKNIGLVPRESLPALMERFKAATSAFYAQHKEHQVQDEADREKNLELKLKLCEDAEALIDTTDWQQGSAKLKQLQEAWKSSGGVPKEKSEEIWNRFRTACDAFYNKRRERYEALDAEKQVNLTKKTELCEKLEALNSEEISAEVKAKLHAIEEEWKAIGMIPKEDVESINSRYTSIVNQILGKYATIDADYAKALEEIKAKKLAMIDKIHQFAESAGSNQLADAVRDLQKEWRTLGSCGLEDSEIYKTYREACDEFFTRRRDQLDIQEQARQNNLQKKVLLCEQAEDLLSDLSDATVGAAMNKVKHLRRLWKEVGAVPRNESDKVWKRFNTACDAVFAFGKKDEEPTEPAAE